MNEKPKFPVIVTYYDNNIDKKIVDYQSKVINKLTQGRIAFRPIHSKFSYSEVSHGDVLNQSIFNLFYETGWDCVLIIDIDCIPLSYEAIEYTLINAYNGNLVGNIQRANHWQNNQHTYVAPSFMCITKEYYEDIGCPTFNNTHKYDVGELMTVNAERFNKPVIKYMPLHSDSGYNENNDYWDLADGMPKYGIGTTFGINNTPVSYHLFNSYKNIWNELFYKKCEFVLNS